MPSAPCGPKRGDIVVYREGDGPSPNFRLRVERQPTQLLFGRYEDAVRDAITYAEIHHVDVWLSSDGYTFERKTIRRAERRRPYSAA